MRQRAMGALIFALISHQEIALSAAHCPSSRRFLSPPGLLLNTRSPLARSIFSKMSSARAGYDRYCRRGAVPAGARETRRRRCLTDVVLPGSLMAVLKCLLNAY